MTPSYPQRTQMIVFLQGCFGGRLSALQGLSPPTLERSLPSLLFCHVLCAGWLLISFPELAVSQWVFSMHLVCQTLEGPLGQKHALPT